MKKLIYLLLLPLVVAVTACGGKVNSKKESVLATQDSVDAVEYNGCRLLKVK